MKRAAPNASHPSLSDASSEQLFAALNNFIWQATPLCAEAQATLKRLQSEGALSHPAAKALAITTAKAMQHFKSGEELPDWDPAVAGPMIALFADSPVEIEVGRDEYDANEVLIAYWVARGGAEGALEALWYASKYCADGAVLAATDPTSDEAKENAKRFAEMVRKAVGPKELRKAEAVIEGLVETGEWYQRWAIALVAPSEQLLAKLQKAGNKSPTWIDLVAD